MVRPIGILTFILTWKWVSVLSRCPFFCIEFKIDFKKKVDISLQRLGLDYVDILYLHSADDPRLVKLNMIKDLMLELKNQGKTRFIGVSTHRSFMLYPIVEEKIYDVVLVSYNFREPQGNKAIAHAAKAGCGIVGMKSMAGVYWDRARKNPINAKAAIKWVLQDENVHTTILGIDTFQQLEPRSRVSPAR